MLFACMYSKNALEGTGPRERKLTDALLGPMHSSWNILACHLGFNFGRYFHCLKNLLDGIRMIQCRALRNRSALKIELYVPGTMII